MTGLSPIHFGTYAPPRFAGRKEDLDRLLADIDDLVGPAETPAEEAPVVTGGNARVEEKIADRKSELRAEIADPSARVAELKAQKLPAAESTVTKMATLELDVIEALEGFVAKGSPDREWILTFGTIARQGVQKKQPAPVRELFYRNRERRLVIEAVLEKHHRKLQWQ